MKALISLSGTHEARSIRTCADDNSVMLRYRASVSRPTEAASTAQAEKPAKGRQ